ncbi:NosD domain-containing protein [Methanolobus sp.]|uniref:NosD domain-containing protein n=1 Tax=Methanolobus sp. TaxID=1874737 RepID=UPI0025FA896A|nr:NosD domain-containing protein [Methanolobus sp.]
MGNAATITVDDSGGADYTSIQDAVNAATAGDTILVSQGTYNENVDVNKQVTITSKDGAQVTNVVAATGNDHVFDVSADGVTIEGINVRGATGRLKAGIYIDSDNNTLSNNIVSDSVYGIFLYISNNNMLNGNTLDETSTGLFLSRATSNTMSNNIISNSVNSAFNARSDGIYLYLSNGNTLNDNLVSNNEDITVDSDYSSYGIVIDRSTSNTLINNIVEKSNTGIEISGSASNTLTNNIVNECSTGIFLGGSNNTLTGNTVTRGSTAIYMVEHSNSNTLTNNILESNFIGIRLSGSSDNTLTSNTVQNVENGRYGIWLEMSNNNTLTNNNVKETSVGIYLVPTNGIYLANSNENELTDNTVYGNDYGISLEISNYNTLINNDVERNNCGIYLDDSSDNILSNNYASTDISYSSGSEHGIFLKASSNNVLISNTMSEIYLDDSSNNEITNNSVFDASTGIYMSYSNNNTIKNNSVWNHDYYTLWGIYMEYSNNNTLINNNLPRNYVDGILLKSSNNNMLIRNRIYSDDSFGIRLTDSSDNTLTNNMIHGRGGIDLSSSSYNTVDSNAYSAFEYGIQLYSSSYNTLVNNNGSSYVGTSIFVSSSNNNTLVGNTVHCVEGTGIHLSLSNDNTLKDNTVSDNAEYGVLLDKSTNNIIYNNFFNNTINVEFKGTNTGNKWNIERTAGTNIIGGPYLGGNYWTKPDGTGFSQNAVDTDGDGISESPYELDADNIDYLPLTDNEVSVPPYPEITSVVIEPQNLHEGDTATVTISVKNTGGPSKLGFISVSFPDNEDIIEVSGTGSNENKLFPVGSSLVTSTSSTITAINPLVQLYDETWDSGQTETLTIKVKVNEGASELKFYVRATLREKDAANYIRTPASSSITDQQGFYVDEHSVDVTSQVLTATITSITPYPATEGTTVSFSGTGTAAYGEIVGYKWSSSIDNELSSSASFSTSNLSVGTHTIDFSVKDDDGTWSDADTETITITITEASNQIPTASITSISPNPITVGNSVFFAGSGSDVDGTIVGYNWESSLDGNLSTSASFSASDISVGTHTISFSVQDDDGAWSDVVSSPLTINAASNGTGNDSVTPVLNAVSPSSGSTLTAGTTFVDVRFNYSDAQTGVNANSVVFIFDNLDVTDNANTTITDSYALYSASGLSTGSHSASVYVVDNSGNSVTFSTSFTISSQSSSSSSSSGSSGGGGGGGGGGSTGETYANIAVKEVDSVFVNKGSHVVYGFNNEGNAISTIEFDSKKNSGSIQTIVEVLKETSALVDADAPGQVYQQMNIWVGKVGFATENNVENMLVTFKVERSWLNDSNVPAESVILYRYSDNIWNKLPTTITREDDEYVYFETKTPGFSPFAISGEPEDVVMSVPDGEAEAAVEEPSEVEVTTSKGISTAGILLMLGVISAVLVGGYILYRKQS